MKAQALFTLPDSPIPATAKASNPAAREAQAIERLAALALELAGLAIRPAKFPMLQARLTRRQRALGLPDLASYADHLGRPERRAEHGAFLGAVTTHVSAFFREPRQFDRFGSELLPHLIRRARSGRKVRLWTAGGAAGQEAQTLAMLVLTAMPDAAAFDIRILTSDIDPAMTGLAQALSVTPAAADAIPAPYRHRFVRPAADGSLRLGEGLRPLLQFATHDLHAPWPAPGPFDAIFCRNVLIYFARDHQERLCTRFAAALRPGGWLCLGHAEAPGTGASAALTSQGDRIWSKPEGIVTTPARPTRERSV